MEPEKTNIAPNHAPVAKAGQDKIVKAGARVVLDGRASTDPDEKDTLSYSWEQTSPSQPEVSLANANAAVASFAAVGTDNKNNKNVITEFTFKLTVRDDRAGLASDTVKGTGEGRHDDKPGRPYSKQTKTKTKIMIIKEKRQDSNNNSNTTTTRRQSDQ